MKRAFQFALLLLVCVPALGQLTITGTQTISGKVTNSLNTAPNASLSTSTLAFGTQQQTVINAPQTVTIYNTGTATLTFSSIAVTSGQFTQTNTCGASIGAGSSCVATVFFAPTNNVAQSGYLTITDNASGSPHSVNLTGHGSPNTVLFQSSPISLGAFTNLNCGAANVDCAVNSSLLHWANNTLQIHYSCGSAPCDVNRWVDAPFAEQSVGIYARGYFYADKGGQTNDAGNQRKLVWMDDGNGSAFDWAFIIVGWYHVADGTMHLAAAPNVASPCAAWADYNIATVSFDQWYEIEVNFVPDTGGSSNASYTL